MDKGDNLVAKPYNSGYIFRITLVATISCFLTGYNIGVVNSSLDNVAKTLDWGSLKSTLISLSNAVFALGGAVGSAISGKISNKLGRRKGIMITDLVSILSCTCVLST